MKTIIFTDLDGSLLDSTTYSFEAARPALDLIKAQDAALVLCSSKTRAEQELIRKRMEIHHPFICENGGGIFVPREYFGFSIGGRETGEYIVIILGLPYSEIRKEFTRVRETLRVPVTGFGDMTAGQIADLTGLPRAEAGLAAKRDFGEAFVFEKSEDRNFLKALENRGLRWTRGKMYHVMGEHDKGKAVRLVKKWYERKHGRIITIGVGDALNDLPLLKEVDHPVLVQKDDGSHEPGIEMPGLIRAQGIGPAGWNKSILQLLQR